MKQLKENQHLVNQVIDAIGRDRPLNQPDIGTSNDFVSGIGLGVNNYPLFENVQNMEVPLGLGTLLQRIPQEWRVSFI